MFRGRTIVGALVLCLAAGSAAWAQDGGWWHRDRRDNGQYGVWQQNQQRNDHDADDGYYGQNRDRDRDRDRDRRNNGRYGNGRYGNGRYGQYGAYGNGAYGRNGNYGYGGNYALGQAQQMGFNDGVMDGRNDAATGHSFRPTESSNYKHANRGWNGSQIDRDSYSQAYRQAYQQGYQQGYGNGGYGRNGYPQPYGWPR